MIGRRWVGTAAAVALLLLAPAVATADPFTLSAGERETLPLVVLTPRGDVSKPVISKLLELVNAAVRPVTSLQPAEVPSEAASACHGRLVCFLDQAAAIVGNSKAAPYVVILSVLTQQGQPDRLSALLLDTTRASEVTKRASEMTPDELDTQINGQAIVLRPAPFLASDDAKTAEWVEGLFRRDFRAAFEASDDWAPFGIVEVTSDLDDVTVALDGTVLGVLRAGVTRVIEIRHGSRKLMFDRSGYAPQEVALSVSAGQTQPVAVSLSRTGWTLRLTMASAGGALLVAGAVITAYGAALGSDLRLVCAGPPGDAQQSCGSSGSRRFRRFGSGAVGVGQTDNGSGPLIVPLGLSLALSGGVIGGSSFFSREDDPPWLAIALGLASGIVAYGLSELLVGADPHVGG